MGVSVEWGNAEKTCLLEKFTPGWDWNDFYQTSQQGVAMMKTVDHTVHVIADFRNSGNLPVGSSAITHARNAIRNFPDNWGTLIVVSDSVFIRSMVGIFRRLFSTGMGSKTHVVATLEEAHALIAAQSTR